jgi:AraC-like DNA-binding protein
MPAIDSTWLDRLIARVQELSLDVVITEQQDLPALVRCFTERLDPVPDPLHTALLANVLLDVCRHTFESLHATLPYDRCTCAAESWTAMMRCARWYESDPKTSLNAWIEAFVPIYERNHPPSVGTRAADLIRREPARRWTVGGIARRLGVTRKTLGSDFRARFGIGPGQYVHAARVALALMQLGKPWKVEALGYEVGYRSKKDFYRAFKRWTGLTPNRVRSLEPEALQLLQASMRARCLWGNRQVLTSITSPSRSMSEGAADGRTQRVLTASPDARAATDVRRRAG